MSALALRRVRELPDANLKNIEGPDGNYHINEVPDVTTLAQKNHF